MCEDPAMTRLARLTLFNLAVAAMGIPADAQFKVTGPPPYSGPVARQKIRALLESANPANRPQTIKTLSGLLVWYRDIFDDEMIAAWQKNPGEDLAAMAKPLGDSKIAASIVEFSWRQRQTAFVPAFAPMFVDLMTRFPDSASPFLNDVLRSSDLNLSQPQQETVCRILLNMPDIRSWKRTGLQVLPRYRPVAEDLLAQDQRSSDPDTRDRARGWMLDLRWDPPVASYDAGLRRRRVPSSGSVADGGPIGPRGRSVDAVPNVPVDPGPPPISTPALAAAPTQPESARSRPSTALAAPQPNAYEGPMSGTLECVGNPVAQNAEYVFRNLPPLKLQLDYDRKIWDARLAPGDGQTQRLILKNKSSGPQKRCVVHWTASP